MQSRCQVEPFLHKRVRQALVMLWSESRRTVNEKPKEASIWNEKERDGTASPLCPSPLNWTMFVTPLRTLDKPLLLGNTRRTKC